MEYGVTLGYVEGLSGGLSDGGYRDRECSDG